MDANSWLIVAYVTTIFAVTAFAAFAVVYTRFYSKTKLDTTEDFIAARGTQNKYRIAWSFFAGAVGAWVIVSPPAYASLAGVLGLVFYSLASGIPLIVAALFGGKIQSAMPDCCSLSDFIGYRFGPVAKMMVILLTLFNMSIAMLAEYTTIGSLFQDFVGSLNYPIIIVVGFLTICYTAYGGLSVSIMTDQLQGAFSVILVTLLSLYVAITFREPLPTPNFGGGFVADLLGPNISGYSAIFVMPCSLMAATVFSEAIWQRVWASEDQKALRFGATAGAIGVIIVVFLIGFSGILGVWSGLIVFCDPMAPEIPCTNPNLYLFSIFKAQGGSSTVSSWVGILTLMLAITMNESAIDSLQNGIGATLSAHWFKAKPVTYARVIVVLINIPLVAVATRGYPVLNLFLITNMLCTCWFIPVVLGLWDSAKGRRYVTETGVVFAGIISMLTTTAYGIGRKWDPSNISRSFALGADVAFFSNGYNYEYFLVAAGSSVVGLALVSGLALALECCGVRGPGVSGVMGHIPGFKLIAGGSSAPTGVQYDLDKGVAIRDMDDKQVASKM